MATVPAPSYWQASAPPFTAGRAGPVAGEFDVAIIGAGFTGLSAARALARTGASVAVLEASYVCAEASGRNGGQCNAGTAHDFGALVASFGLDRARRWYLSHCDAVDTVERIAVEESIDCAFTRCGRAKLAAKPQHFAKLEAAYAGLSGSDRRLRTEFVKCGAGKGFAPQKCKRFSVEATTNAYWARIKQSGFS